MYIPDHDDVYFGCEYFPLFQLKTKFVIFHIIEFSTPYNSNLSCGIHTFQKLLNNTMDTFRPFFLISILY